jgi:hypothetical protein
MRAKVLAKSVRRKAKSAFRGYRRRRDIGGAGGAPL